MKIGLVTITFNSADVLPEFLDSVAKQTYQNFFLYVIDNASTDNTIQEFEFRKKQNYQLIPNKNNLGVAAGNNQGIKKALLEDCDFVLLINNDTVFEEKLLQKLVDAYHQYGSSIITPKMMYYESNNVIWYAGGFFDRKKAWLNYHRGQNEVDKGQFQENDIVEYAPTCCALIHRSVFDDVGLMDEKYFVYFDDTDFFYRFVKNGKHEARYFNDVQFYHKIGSLTKSRTKEDLFKYGDFFVKQMTCNQIYYLRKQKTLFAYLYILYFILRVQIRFLLSGRYHRSWRTFILIQQSIIKGLRL